MNKFIAWLRQPSTLTAFGVAVAAAVYWFTKSAELAAVALAAVLGTVSDSTSALLTKVESIENIVASIVVPSNIPTVTHTATVGDASTTTKGSVADVVKVLETVIKPVATLMLVIGLVFGLAACGTQTAPTVAAVTATLAQAKSDVQNAINLYEFSKGVAGVAVLANPTLAPAVAKATDLADPIAVKAQLTLNDATADAAMLEALVTQVTQLANALTLQTANVIKVVPAS